MHKQTTRRKHESAEECYHAPAYLSAPLEDFRKIPEPKEYPGKPEPPYAIHPENTWVAPVTTIGVVILIGGLIYFTGGTGAVLIPVL